MTVERRIIVGLEDIKAVSLECNECHSKITLPPDLKSDIPASCERCNHPWRAPQVVGSIRTCDSIIATFTHSIPTIRELMHAKSFGFSVLLEFDEPK